MVRVSITDMRSAPSAQCVVDRNLYLVFPIFLKLEDYQDSSWRREILKLQVRDKLLSKFSIIRKAPPARNLVPASTLLPATVSAKAKPSQHNGQHRVFHYVSSNPASARDIMIRLPRRWYGTLLTLVLLFLTLHLFRRLNELSYRRGPAGTRYPPPHVNKLPTTQPRRFEPIQFTPGPETDLEKDTRELRRERVKSVFQRAWAGYTQEAWGKDELRPLSGAFATTFGGWGATLVDSLDTLWIMGMREEFEQAVQAASKINFNVSESATVNVFETTIRYLGGFLGAYDISDGAYPVLLSKAIEIGELLYRAFDTPNRMPITRWNWNAANSPQNPPQEALNPTLAAELGSLTLEFTRLSQLTGDTKFYDAIYTITSAFSRSQSSTKLPGLWPFTINAASPTGPSFRTGAQFGIGGMADSLYEYLPKQYLLLGGTVPVYKTMYANALQAMKAWIFFRPLAPDPSPAAARARAASAAADAFTDTEDRPPAEEGAAAVDVLLSGDVYLDGRSHKLVREPKAQHLGCFAGGMVGLAAKVFGTESEDMPFARRLVGGCVWAYGSLPMGIGAEVFHVVPCQESERCMWDEASWRDGVLAHFAYGEEEVGEMPPEEKFRWLVREKRLPPGYTFIDDPRYILRPEAIESVFVLYRLTGDKELLEAGWRMFEAIETATATRLGSAGVRDVTVRPPSMPEKQDRMESFWMAETLKYFYLLYEEAGVVSLDRFVL